MRCEQKVIRIFCFKILNLNEDLYKAEHLSDDV